MTRLTILSDWVTVENPTPSRVPRFLVDYPDDIGSYQDLSGEQEPISGVVVAEIICTDTAAEAIDTDSNYVILTSEFV